MCYNYIILHVQGLSFGAELLITIILVIGLIWLYHTFFVKPSFKPKQNKSIKTIDTEQSSPLNLNETNETNEEVSAVIGLALHLYKQQLSDYEKVRLTIARVSRTYSPWSSKIYGLRQNPRR
jgi:hypothetical protein